MKAEDAVPPPYAAGPPPMQPGWNYPGPSGMQQPMPQQPMPQMQPLPPPPPYATMQPQPQQTIVVASMPQTTTIVTFMWGHRPQRAICNSCRSDIVTEVYYTMGSFAWLMFCLFCLFCFCIFWLPCVASGFKDAEHRCPNCKAYLGKHLGSC